MLAYEGFCQSILDKKATAVVLVEDYGNRCGIAYLFKDQDHITSVIGWLRHENSIESSPIKIGAPVVGKNETLFYCEALLELKKCIFESTMLWILV